MPDHKRKTIRIALKNILVNAATAAGQNVFANRAYPVFNSQLPVILIYTKSEPASSPLSPYDRVVERNLELVIDVCAQANNALDDVLDGLAKQIEDAMNLDETIGGLANRSYLTDTQIEFIASGEKTIGSMKMTYVVNYHTGLPGEQ